ncbi:MAG TPA: M28 family peptidase [Verrucomicrobiae bacterium]|nr:M28 family peptidase [Verrucomicrobiae bacterium]
MTRVLRLRWGGVAALALLLSASCGHGGTGGASADSSSAAKAAAPLPASPSAASLDAAPPASETGGFDGRKAYEHVAKLVSFGPHPPASDAIHRVQDYIRSQLKMFGCATDEDDFNAQTPIGTLAMKNIVAKIPGNGQGIILLLTHYDTLRLDNFVGADDSGSSTGLMLEMARILCSQPKRANAVWIAFLDGEEAQVVTGGQAQWSDADSVYGSRELAARLAVSGKLKTIKAVILADMIGQRNLEIPRESSSTRWLTDLVWHTAKRLGYKDIFVSREEAVSDDHGPFLSRNVPATDIIDYSGYVSPGYWHTPQDTLDKISARSLAVVGHVILESVAELQKR